MIRLENIYKTFKKDKQVIHAINGIDLYIEKGDIYGIIGYSGSGKSTLLRTVNLLERPTSGRVFYKNEEITEFSERELIPYRRNIGMIFQHFNLLSSATVFKNIAFPLELIDTPYAEIEKKVESLLDLVELGSKRNEHPSNLSGGQKQRVAIARALATNPEVLLCDEGTSALDPKTTRSILALLKQINQVYGITIILITHEMEVVKSICNKVSVLSDGMILESDSVHEVILNSKSEVTRDLLNTSFLI